MGITRVHVSGFTAQVMSREPLVAGTVGMPVEFTFGEDWQNLKKTAVFRCDGVSYTVLELESTAVIPWELLQKPGCTLKAGVCGASEDGSVQTPTLWAELGKIQEGADPDGDQSADPTLPVWQQISEKKLDKPKNAPEVGKILKVTAVNEDGTFTCQWADLPAHSWRLIVDAAIEEKVGEVVFWKDISGNDYALRDAVFIVRTPACPDYANMAGYVQIGMKDINDYPSLHGAIQMASKTEDTYWTARASMIPGAPMYVQYSNAMGIGVAKSAYSAISFGNRLNSADAIRKLGIQMNYGIPAGTKIQVWGVDA